MATPAPRSALRASLHRFAPPPPPRATALSEWALLPLRAFLGFTFIFAGIQKMANPAFFSATSPAGIRFSMVAAEQNSPIGFLLRHLVGGSTAIGWFMAFGELAVGLGTAFGLWGRVAATGGLLISFSLFLTVSWNASPWFTGADIVYCFAWVPLLLAGSGSWSIDGLIARKNAAAFHLPSPVYVAVAFDRVTQLCGFHEGTSCTAVAGRSCGPVGCPFLEGTAGVGSVTTTPVAEISRRTLVNSGAAAVILGGAGAAFAGMYAEAARARDHADNVTTTTTGAPTTTTTTGSTPAGLDIGAASKVAVDAATTFTLPSNGDPGLAIHLAEDQFVAYNAVCPHAGCTVAYYAVANVIACPCHGSEFDPATGAVIQGPAPHGLGVLSIEQGPNGDLYVAD